MVHKRWSPGTGFIGGSGTPPVAPSDALTDLLESSANLSSYTFNSVNIGTPHADRVVALVIVGSTGGGATSVTIDGNVMSLVAAPAGITIRYLRWPTGTTANIVVNWNTGMTSTGMAVYAIYPTTEAPLDDATDSGTASTGSLADLNVVTGGRAIWGLGRAGTSGSTTMNWNGVNAEVTDANANGPGDDAGSWCIGHVFNISETIGTRDVAISMGVSNTFYAVGASWGA